MQLLALQELHSRGIVHRDLSLGNILTASPASSELVLTALRDHERVTIDALYLADLGMALPLGHASDGVCGNELFASHRAHESAQLSQRDDIESLMYVLMYLLRSNLPWIVCGEPEDIRDLKCDFAKVDTFCASLPSAISKTFAHIRGLDYLEIPDYALLCDAFADSDQIDMSIS